MGALPSYLELKVTSWFPGSPKTEGLVPAAELAFQDWTNHVPLRAVQVEGESGSICVRWTFLQVKEEMVPN